MKPICLICARGGSKGVVNKNIRIISKKPLIAHTIKSAIDSKLFSHVVVSTEDEEIAKISKKYGAEIPFMRPKKFSLDKSSTLDVVQHATEFLQKEENYIPDIITILLPTCPFRPSNLIDNSIQLLKKTNATSVVSVSKAKKHAFKAFVPKNGFLKPFRKDYRKFYQRQLLPDFYHTTGAAYTFWFKTLKKYGHYYGPRMKPLISTDNKINIDVDDVFDLFIAEMTKKYWEKYLKKIKG